MPKPIIKDEKEINDVAWIRLSDLDNDLDIPDYTKYIIYHAFSKRNFLKIDNQWNAERLKSGRFLKYEHFL
ncbi:hypothetical protein [Candidatus Hodarchaeum mangrovi]